MADAEATDVYEGYQRLSSIASGGQCTVFEVVEQATGRHLAMKLVLGDTPNYAEAAHNLKHEYRVGSTMAHPNVIQHEKASIGRDYSFIVMEYFRAANVKTQLKQELLTLQSRARRLFEGTCIALIHMHELRWVHRDLKPENILLNRAGEVRLLDFSLAVRPANWFGKLLNRGSKVIVGTRTYIAPETIRKEPATFATDIYSLGITFFEVLTGKTPYQASSPQELLMRHLTAPPPPPSDLNPNVSPEMDRIVMRMMAKKPANRPKSVDELLGELRRIKIFKVDPDQLIEEQKKKAEQTAAQQTEKPDAGKVDSRADAARSTMLKENPELAAQAAEEARLRMKKKAEKQAEAKAKAERISKGASAPPEKAPPAVAPAAPVPAPIPGFPAGQPLPPGYGAPPQFAPAPPAYPPGYPGGPPGFAPPPRGPQQPAGYPTTAMTGPPGAPPRPAGPPVGYPGTQQGGGPQSVSQPPGAGVRPPGSVGQPLPPGQPARPGTPPGNPGAPVRFAPTAQPSASAPSVRPPQSGPPVTPVKPSVPAPQVDSRAAQRHVTQQGDSANPDDIELMTELPDIL